MQPKGSVSGPFHQALAPIVFVSILMRAYSLRAGRLWGSSQASWKFDATTPAGIRSLRLQQLQRQPPPPSAAANAPASGQTSASRARTSARVVTGIRQAKFRQT